MAVEEARARVRVAAGATGGGYVTAVLAFAGQGVMSLVALALILMLAPTALVMIGACTWAYRAGWPWTRVRNLFVGSLVIPVMLAVLELDPRAPVRAFWAGVVAFHQGAYGAGLAQVAVLTIPAGYFAAWLWWARLQRMYERGQGRSLEAGERHFDRQRRARSRAARKNAQLPTPLTEGGDLVLGPLTDQTGGMPGGLLSRAAARHPFRLVIPSEATRRHLVIQADTGAGKTVTLRRIAAAVTEASWQRYAAGQCGRPLVVMVDCKGGPNAAEDGWAFTDTMTGLGLDPDRVGLWPLETRLDMWRMNPRDLQETLHELAKTDQQYYAELQRALLHVVVDAPIAGPPTSSADFLARLHPDWLAQQWQGHPVELEMVKALQSGREPALASNLLLYSNLWRDLALDFDSGRPLTDLDALYCVIHGTRRPAEAKARAAALLQIIKDAISRDAAEGRPREVTLILDEFSAVSDIPLYLEAERWRSLGCGVIVCGQSWASLGPDEDSRHRLVDTCSGGRLQMRSPNPEELAAKTGTWRRLEASRHIQDAGPDVEGASRMQDAFVVDPQRVRAFDVGEIVYHNNGRAWWGRVVPLPTGYRSQIVTEVARQRPALTSGERISLPELLAAQPDADAWSDIIGRFGGDGR